MQTTINQLSDVEFELEIQATAEDLAPALNKALKAQRARTQMRGFRPGKVPLSLVKRMYGEAIAQEVAGQSIQDVYEAEVLNGDDHEVLGQPSIEVFDYKIDGDLRAVVHFGIRPTFELEDLSAHQVTRQVHTVTDEDIDEEIERLRRKEADLLPIDDEAAGEEDFVVVDLQRLDDTTRTPLIGEKDEDTSFFLNDPRIPDVLKTALVGKTVGDAVQVDLPHDHDHGAHDHAHHEHHTHPFEVTLKELKRRDLPDLDEDFFSDMSDGEAEDEAGFREHVRTYLTSSWEEQLRDALESQIVDKLVELHRFPLPKSVVELYLDSFVQELNEMAQGALPPNFDVEGYRESRREEAEQQARWMFIRDKVIDQGALAVTDEDRDRYFGEMAERGVADVDKLRQYYEAIPRLSDQLDQRLLNEKVFGWLTDRFDVVEEEMEAEEAQEND